MLITSTQWRAAYPGASVGILAMEGVANPADCPGLSVRKAEVEARLRERYGQATREALKELPEIAAYTAYYRRFKKTYHVLHQLESVAAGRPLPSGAALVEAMVIAELENMLLTAGHDLDTVELPLQVDVAQGTETYIHLSGAPQVLKPEDMIIADSRGILSSIIYGPDQRTRITAATRRVIFTVYAPVGIAPHAVARHLDAIACNVRLITPDARITHQEIATAGQSAAT